ncbi:substrate-binding domain-containing protein, partial [Nonomuraea rubra]|uniref:substrate-binding domain-containing protein n=1 Tax=Nonomuraea rubra TaxID=46180 RepID=UPI0031E7A288
MSHQTVSRVLNGPSERPGRHPRPGGGGDHPAGLPAQPRGSRPGHQALEDPRRGVLRHHAVRPRQRTIYGIEQAARTAGYFVSIVSLKSIDADNVRDAIDYLDRAGRGRRRGGRPATLGRARAGEPALGPARGGGRGHAQGRRVGRVHRPDRGGQAGPPGTARPGPRYGLARQRPHDWLETEGRLEGWRAALEEAGRPVPEPLAGDWSPRAGYEGGKSLAAMDGVTAVFAANDQMALGVLRALSEKGVKVPQQISVVGFDDIPESEVFSPPLTTVRQDFDVVGR